MLKITERQYATLHDATVGSSAPAFVRRWVATYAPYALEGLTPARVEARIAHCVERAIAWGLSSDRGLAAVALGMFAISPAFGRVPSFARVLGDASLGEAVKIRALESRDAAPSWAKAGMLDKRWPGDAAW